MPLSVNAYHGPVSGGAAAPSENHSTGRETRSLSGALLPSSPQLTILLNIFNVQAPRQTPSTPHPT